MYTWLCSKISFLQKILSGNSVFCIFYSFEFLKKFKNISFIFFLLPCFLAFAGNMGNIETWDGFYVGANGGASWGILTNHLNMSNNPNAPLFYEPVLPNINTTGSGQYNAIRGSGGAQVGFNFSFTNKLLIGLELNYDYVNLEKNKSVTTLYTNSPNSHVYSLTSSAKASQMGTLHPRLGYHVGSYLPYFTAGAALTRINFDQTFTDLQYQISHTNTLHQNRWGWVIGGGLEYLPIHNVSFRIEYLYAYFGNSYLSSPFLGTGILTGLSANVANSIRHINLQTLLLGVNYHFA